MISVELDRQEYGLAARAGLDRQTENTVARRRDAYQFSGNGSKIHVIGAVGEFVAAKGLRLPWNGKGTFRGADVGSYQIRSSEYEFGRLALHPQDGDDLIFISVRPVPFPFPLDRESVAVDLVGWLYGREGKRREWWKDITGRGRPAFFVSDLALRSMSDLPQPASPTGWKETP